MDKSIRIQHELRQSSEDVQVYFKDLGEFIEDMKDPTSPKPQPENINIINVFSEKDLFSDDSEDEEAPPDTEEDENSGAGDASVSHIARKYKVKANKEMKSGNLKEAIRFYTESIHAEMNDYSVYYKRALCYKKMNQLYLSEMDCSKAIDLDQNSMELLVWRGLIRELLGKYEEAHTDIQKALDKCKSIFLEAAVARLKAVYLKSWKVSPSYSKADNLKEEGNNAVKSGKFVEALKFYAEAIIFKADEPTLYANRALCYLKLKMETLAEIDCTAAVTLNPNYTKAYLRRAKARKIGGNLKGAITDLKRVLCLEPRNRDLVKEITNITSIVHSRQNDPVGSDSEEELFNAENPNGQEKKEWQEDLKLAKGHMKCEEWEKATHCLTEIIEKYNCREAYLKRSQCYLNLGDLALAEADCQKSISMGEKNSSAYSTRALLKKRKGDIQAARLDYQEAVRLNPADNWVKSQLEIVNSMIRNDRDLQRPVDVAKDGTKLEPFDNKVFKEVDFITKHPHQRSKKPLKVISVDDIPRSDGFPFLESDVKSKLDEQTHSQEDDDVKIPRQPLNFIEFIEGWSSLNHKADVQYLYLMSIGPERLSDIFKGSLTVEAFSEMVRVLHKVGTEGNKNIFEFLQGLAEIKRFKTLCMFLSGEEKGMLSELIDRCVANNHSSQEKADNLKTLYGLGK